jgi:hypothetical protein
MFGKNGYSLSSFSICTDSVIGARILGNRLILEEMQYDKDSLRATASYLYEKLNEDQLGIYKQVMAAATGPTGKLFFYFRPWWYRKNISMEHHYYCLAR